MVEEAINKGDIMKYLLALTLLVTSLFAQASDRELKEVYVSLEPTIQLVLTNLPCKLFTAPETVQLNFAYAQNMETGDKVSGCFTHVGDIIQVELVDPSTKEFYEYKIHADKFQLRPNL